MPVLDPAALRAFGIHEEPKAAMKRLLALGPELHVEMEKADAFASIIRGDEDENESAAGDEREAESKDAAVTSSLDD